MTFQDLIIPIIFYLTIMSVVLLCYAPAKNHFRYNRVYTIAAASILCVLLSVATYVLTAVIQHDFGIFNILGILLLFIFYHRSLTLHISQTSAIYLLVSAFTSFLANFSIIYDAMNHPDGDLKDYSLRSLILLMILCMIFSAIFVYPFEKYGSFLLDNLQQPRVWWMSAVVSAVFYFFNLRMVVHRYSTLHTNKVGIAYITVMFTMFILLILLSIIFYFIVGILIKKSETENRNRFFMMQEKQYEALQHYIDADARQRHDFRQTIYTLKELSAEKDYQAIDDYLNRYIKSMPQKETKDFCNEPALNALLNHYARLSEKNSIKIDIRVLLPSELLIDITDLCSIIGNVLENAITACLDIPEEKRFIHVNLSNKQGSEFYIAISNSFSGKATMKNGHFLSTKKGGSGIGLVSIAATAEHYGGSASFRHESDVFYSDIMLENNVLSF